MEIDLNKFTSKTWVAVIFIWVTIISSGTLFIYLFRRDLFTSLDLIKLILLASSIPTPIWLINCGFAIFLAEETFRNESGDLDFLLLAICSGLITIPVFYVPFLIRFYSHCTLFTGITWILSLEFLLLAIASTDIVLERKRGKKKLSRISTVTKPK